MVPTSFLRVLELVGFTLLVLVAVTQLVIPLWRGTPLFPLFRREGKLEGELERARQVRLEAELRERIERERRNIEEEK